MDWNKNKQQQRPPPPPQKKRDKKTKTKNPTKHTHTIFFLDMPLDNIQVLLKGFQTSLLNDLRNQYNGTQDEKLTVMSTQAFKDREYGH